MPRLAKSLVKKVSDAEEVTGGFELLKSGKYQATLTAVDIKESNNGKPGWNWEFSKLKDLDGESVPGRQWLWTMLPGQPRPKGDDEDEDVKKWETSERLSAGRIKSLFITFGFEPDSDTDEMLGEKCLLQIGIRTQKAGPNKGEQQNYIVRVLPLDGEELNGDEDDDEEF